jgi:hypothetical protein
MTQSRTIEVFQALEDGRLRQIGLSAEQIRRLCPESSSPDWSVQSILLPVAVAQGIVRDWGDGREHVHWQCPICEREHISDFEPHADSNPVLWFCEQGAPEDICLVYWRGTECAEPDPTPDRPRE